MPWALLQEHFQRVERCRLSEGVGMGMLRTGKHWMWAGVIWSSAKAATDCVWTQGERWYSEETLGTLR